CAALLSLLAPRPPSHPYTHPPPPAPYPLSLHDALPIWAPSDEARARVSAASSPHRRAATSTEIPRCKMRSRRAAASASRRGVTRSEEHTSELQSREKLVCRLLLEKKKTILDNGTSMVRA